MQWEYEGIIKETMPVVPIKGIGPNVPRTLSAEECSKKINTDIYVVFHSQPDAEGIMDLYHRQLHRNTKDDEGVPIADKPALILDGYEYDEDGVSKQTSQQIENKKWKEALLAVNKFNCENIAAIDDLEEVAELSLIHI